MGKCKNSKKGRGNVFMEELKEFQPKTTVQLPDLFQLYPGQFFSTKPYEQYLEATQTFDDDQTYYYFIG